MWGCWAMVSRQAAAVVVEEGSDSEQPSFCLQLLNSCTAKVHCMKAQWGGAVRQLHSRRTKGACCLRKHARRRTSALKNQNTTKQTYATASWKVSDLLSALFAAVYCLLKHLSNLVKLMVDFNLEIPLDYQSSRKTNFATITPARIS